MIGKSNDKFITENKVVPSTPILVKIKINKNKLSSPEIQRVQFPLSLAWASSVHKVSGLTLKKVVISFQLFKQKSFNYGQIYVALSRATSLEGISVPGKLEAKDIKADPRVHREYERLRGNSTMKKINKSYFEDNDCICAVLVNIRSLRKHSIDINSDKNISKCDLLLLTETQLMPRNSNNIIRDNLCPLLLRRQDNDDKYCSFTSCLQ